MLSSVSLSACYWNFFITCICIGNPVVQYFHGYVVNQMKCSLLNTKMMQIAGDFITVWFMKFVMFLSRGDLIPTEHPDGNLFTQ